MDLSQICPKMSHPSFLAEAKGPKEQRLLFILGEMCFFLITCQDLEMVYNLEIQLEPLMLLDCRVTDGGFSAFCYV